MRTLRVFDNVSLDGYFVDAGGDMSWAHKHDEEWNAFASRNAGRAGELLFGRVTYQMMAAFWPTPRAAEMLPAVAAGMNATRKYVCSRTLQDVSWQNTTLLQGDLIDAVRRLKATSGPDIVILGSGRVVSQLTSARLIDGFDMVVNPVVLGKGRTLFETVGERVPLKRTNLRQFANGNLVVSYSPA